MVLQKNLLEQQTHKATLEKTKVETHGLQVKQLRDQTAAVQSDADLGALRETAMKLYGPQAVAGMPQSVSDPAWAEFQRKAVMDSDKFLQTAQQDRTFTETQRHNKVTELHAALTQKETARHHAALEGDPQTIEDTAQAIATGKLAPLSGFALSRPMAQNIMSRVVQINPEFDPTQFQTRQKAEKDFATGKQGNSVRSFNVALSHLETLDSLADALHNGNIKIINEIGNRFASEAGGAAPTNFVAAKKIVSDEIVKAIVGSGGGVTDREEAAKTIAAANSPAQLKGVINTYKELMRGQLGGLRDQYKATTGKDDFDTKYLSESGRQVAHGKPAPAAKGGIKFLGFE
jgi:hypothetical protein